MDTRTWLRGSCSSLDETTDDRKKVEGKVTQRHFKTRTLGITVMESGVKVKVTSEVLDEVTQKNGVMDKNRVSRE